MGFKHSYGPVRLEISWLSQNPLPAQLGDALAEESISKADAASVVECTRYDICGKSPWNDLCVQIVSFSGYIQKQCLIMALASAQVQPRHVDRQCLHMRPNSGFPSSLSPLTTSPAWDSIPPLGLPFTSSIRGLARSLRCLRARLQASQQDPHRRNLDFGPEPRVATHMWHSTQALESSP